MMINPKYYPWGIAAVAALLFLPFLGGVHLFDWDEINFAECAREMLVSGDYLHVQMSFLSFYEKPPLFIWLQAMAMHLFGINEYAARLPNAIFGIITLLTIYFMGKKIHQNATFGLWWALAYAGSILPHFYFKSGIIDPVFNYFIFLAYYYFVQFYQIRKEKISSKNEYKYLVMSGLWLGFALLTKGPVAYLIFSLCVGVYTLFANFSAVLNGFNLKKMRLPIHPLQFILFTVLACVPMGVWYGIDIYHNGWKLVVDFVVYQYRLFSTEDAGHGGFVGYHVVVLLVGCFPASIFALRAMGKWQADNEKQQNFRLWALVLFWVVLVLFSLVQSKIVHYSSLCYFPLTYCAACALQALQNKTITFSRPMRVGIIAVAALIAFVLIVLPFAAQQIEVFKPLFANDTFAQANLNANVTWTGGEASVGLLFVALIFVAFRYMKQQKIKHGLTLFFVATICAMQGIFYFYIANIEKYSQNAALEFFKSVANKDVYVATYGYKSYAHYFYAKMQPSAVLPLPDSEWENFWFNGEIDKDVYISVKNYSEADLKGTNLIRLYEKNGFVFYKRNKVK